MPLQTITVSNIPHTSNNIFKLFNTNFTSVLTFSPEIKMSLKWGWNSNDLTTKHIPHWPYPVCKENSIYWGTHITFPSLTIKIKVNFFSQILSRCPDYSPIKYFYFQTGGKQSLQTSALLLHRLAAVQHRCTYTNNQLLYTKSIVV